MMLRCAKRGVVAGAWIALLAGISAASARADDSASAQPQAQAAPSWANETLGHVNYSYLGDQRTHNEQFTYRINEDGLITGQEFLAQPAQDSLAEMIYERMIATHPAQLDPEKSPAELSRDFRGQLQDRRMAILILNRILDHEAMKHKLEPEVPNARVNYIMRSILIQFGASSGHLRAHGLAPKMNWVMGPPRGRPGAPLLPLAPTCHQEPATDRHGNPVIDKLLDEDPSLRSNEEMYGWLKQAVGENQLDFETDWTYSDLGTHMEHDHLRDSPDIGWPSVLKRDPATRQPVLDDHCNPIQQEQSVSMSFERMPASWREFQAAIRQQLQATYRQYLRLTVWKALVMDRNPTLSWQSMFAATPDQFDQMYNALRDTPAIQIPRATASFSEVSASGSKAPEFKARYLALLDEAEAVHEPEFTHVDPATVLTQAGRAEWIARIASLRHTIQAEAYRKAVSAPEFATEIIDGRLRVSTARRSVTHSALDADGQPGQGPGFADQEERSAFDMAFFTQRLIPRLVGVDSNNSIKIMTMTDLAQNPIFREKDDPAVREVLRQQIENRLRGKAYRKLAFDLFQLNRFEFSHNFCEDPGWPCSYADDQRVAPRLLAEALFPETLYPGQELPTMLTRDDGTGNMVSAPVSANNPRISSTLNHDEYFDRVQEVSITNLDRVFLAPDDHVDYGIRFHNY